MSSTAEELSGQAEELRNTVEFFKVMEDTTKKPDSRKIGGRKRKKPVIRHIEANHRVLRPDRIIIRKMMIPKG
jgi:hypothetical protein